VGIVYEASGQGIITNNTLRRSGLSGILVTMSQNVEIYWNVLEDNYRGIEYFVDCASVGQGGYNRAANRGAGVIYDLLNNNTHDNIVKIGSRSGSLANTLFLSNCSSTKSDAYLYGSKNLMFQHNSYYVPSLTAQLWYWGGVSRFWSEWQALGQDTSGSVQPSSEYAAPVITSTGSVTGTVGVTFSYQIIATNRPTSFNATGLPTGLSVNTVTGLISGTPTTSGTSSVTLSATNAFGTGTRPLTVTINPGQAPVITSPSTATATTGIAFSYQITATNNPTSFDASRLPAGLSVSRTTGLVSGTPTNVGTTSNIVLRATNAVGTGTQGLTLTVNAGLPPGSCDHQRVQRGRHRRGPLHLPDHGD
jgi:putative Ig domain-containing protein